MIPSRECCLDLLEEHDVPENIRKHSFKVNEIAVFLARKLKEKGINIEVKLVDRASLLHDLDKMDTLKNINQHGKLAAELLEKKGISREIQSVVLNHCGEAELSSWEIKVVNYADKRVLHDKLVSLKERFEYLRKRYPKYHKNKTEKESYKLEKEIFDMLDINPEDLEKVMI